MKKALALLVLASCAGPSRPPAAFDRAAINKAALMGEQSFATEKIAETHDASVHITRVKGRMPPHLHASHDEIVSVLDGHGLFILGGRKIELKPGDLYVIPRGTVHSFEGEASVQSVFTPPFDDDDDDRVLVKP